MNFRPTFWAAALAVATSLFLAYTSQLALLGALGFTSSRDAAALLPLEAAANSAEVPAVDGPGGKGLRLDASRGAAVVQAKSLALNAADVLAVTLNSEEISSRLRLTLGWLSTQDIRRPATATVNLPPETDAHQTTLVLTGHPRWREKVTQMALAVEATEASRAPPGLLLTRAEWLPANPVGGTRLMSRAWFERGGSIITASESANRLLPLALWFALICAVSVATVALMYRKQPEQRAAALLTTAGLLVLLALVLTVASNRWPGWTVPLGAGVAVALALVLIDSTVKLPLSAMQRTALAATCLGAAIVLSPLVAAMAVIPALLLWIAPKLTEKQSALSFQAAGLAALVPVLLLASVAQGILPAPTILKPLVDPTQRLAAIATAAGGIPGLALGLLAMHQLWPAPASAARWSTPAMTATVWALVTAVTVLTVPKIAVLATGGSTYLALFVPALVCAALAIYPKFQSVARSIDETVRTTEKSEADLSAQALALLQSHAERVQSTLARGETGAAHAALSQMQRMAPAAQATALASLRIALSENDLNTAQAAASQLEAHSTLGKQEHDALLELAHRQNAQHRVIELAPLASLSEANTRARAIAELLTADISTRGGPEAALAVLKNATDWAGEGLFAREIAELHLLLDDFESAQLALVDTGIALDEPLGQAYIARLGLRALGAAGPREQAQAISKLATWHPQLGCAHAAAGELMLRQNNPTGARARLVLAMKLDPALWPLQFHLRRQGEAAPVNATA